LSNLIKSGRVVSLDDLKRLELIQRPVVVPQNSLNSGAQIEGNAELDVETKEWKDRILQDAERTAQDLISQAKQTADEWKAAAEQEIEAWWQARRAEDEQAVREASQQGFDAGYEAGARQAEEQLRLAWEDRMLEARRLLEQAYSAKENIIAEAEAFVVELSCSIAGKLLAERLAEAPETSIKLYAQALSRRREQGVITLCVAPDHFGFVQAAKDELSLMLDAQAELQILPDATVDPGGCIVRSSFGSTDARIDTQLAAIRAELLRIAAHAAEEGNDDDAS